MKFTIALVALFLVCAAQARAVEGDDKKQLHVFVDHLEATVKPALTKTYHEVEQIKSDMENAKKETVKIFDGHEEDVLASLHPVGSVEMRSLVDKLKVDMDDQFACESKMIHEVFKCGAILDVHYQCAEDKSSKSLQTVDQALKMLHKAFVVIDHQAEIAKKCADDYTLSTSFNLTECLTKAKFAVDKHLKDLEQLNLLKLKDQYHQLLNELEKCKPSEKTWEDLTARLRLAGNTVKNCLLNSSNKKKVE